jgi:hypothetical protein
MQVEYFDSSSADDSAMVLVRCTRYKYLNCGLRSDISKGWSCTTTCTSSSAHAQPGCRTERFEGNLLGQRQIDTVVTLLVPDDLVNVNY